MAFHQQLLSSATPEVNHLIWHTVFMGAIPTSGRDGDVVRVVPISRGLGDGIVIVAMYAFHAGVIVI